MPGRQPPACGPARARQVTVALWLVSISVAFGLLRGAVSGDHRAARVSMRKGGCSPPDAP